MTPEATAESTLMQMKCCCCSYIAEARSNTREKETFACNIVAGTNKRQRKRAPRGVGQMSTAKELCVQPEKAYGEIKETARHCVDELSSSGREKKEERRGFFLWLLEISWQHLPENRPVIRSGRHSSRHQSDRNAFVSRGHPGPVYRASIFCLRVLHHLLRHLLAI